MNAMNRRVFLGRSAALAGAAMLPLPRTMSVVPVDGPVLRWFAVGNDEMSYPFLAENAEAARREYAWVHGATIGEECPECGEYCCHEHNHDLDAPLDWVEVSHEFGHKFGPGNEPKMVDWVRAGFNVPCEICDCGEPTECFVFDGQAVCDCCLEIAKIGRLDRLVGTAANTPHVQWRY